MLKFIIRIAKVLFFISAFCIPKLNGQIYKNPNTNIEDRITDLMDKMTLEEKIGQMCQFVAPAHIEKTKSRLKGEELIYNDQWGTYPGLNAVKLNEKIKKGEIGSFLHVKNVVEANELQKIAQKSRLGIPLLIGIDAIHGHGMVKGTTIFPTQIGLSSTWDDQLIYEVAKATAKEVRATGMHWTFSPNVEVARDPRWGRVGETFGEDPMLVGRMGQAFTKGYQGNFSDENVIACAKHFIAGGEPYNGTNASPIDVSERQLREIWLPPFKKQIEAGVFTFMASHNEINGVPAHANKFLLNDILKNEWKFDGFVVSDWMDIERIHKLHKLTSDKKESVLKSVNSGMGMHMHGPGFMKPLLELVEEGLVPVKKIDDACMSILKAKFLLGLFENPFVDQSKTKSILFNEGHKELALNAARKSIVLLKNNGILPLNNPKKILITGPNANNHRILGDWTFKQPDANVQTVYQGFQKVFDESNVDFINSGESLLYPDDTKLEGTISKAEGYDAIIVVLGSNSLRFQRKEKTCGENVDRSQINLLGNQLRLVQELYKINNNIVVVMVNGRPLSEPWITENIPGIIEAWEPGSFAGQAIAEIVKGEINPSGKLTITFPHHSGQIPMVYNQKPSSFFRKYIDAPSAPMWHFGYGLSYSEFQYSNPYITKLADGFMIEIEIENKSSIEGDEITQLYIRDEVSSVTRPLKELIDYKRITLKGGEKKIIPFEFSIEDLAFYNVDMQKVVESGDFLVSIGSSSREEDLIQIEFNIDKNFNYD
ncbi:MAG: beta-glucosidase [Flammeovirgaceae bacterium]|nr:beta-glucosidase [Flammeovirgaceae bacterium]